jgi:NTP pyrophosphatase (non-canonical NTP hydrolase)
MIPRNEIIRAECIEAINTVATAVHLNARAKGFHDDTDAEFIPKTCANMHGEVSELWEAYRRGTLTEPCDKQCGLTNEEEELADIVIRAFDTSKRRNIDIGLAILKKHDYNLTREYRHGNKAA